MKVIMMRPDGGDMVFPMALFDSTPRDLPLINSIAADIEQDKVDALEAHGFQVFPDERLFIPPYPPRVRAAFMYPTQESRPETPGPMKQMEETGVEELRELGYSGAGVHVGIADTGVDDEHPDLVGRLDRWGDFVDHGNVEPKDPNGHGTACAGIMSGAGASVAKFHGVAPGVTFSMARVLDSDGGGYTSAIIEGLGWLAEQGCEIINVSLGSTSVLYTPMSKAVDELCARGIIVCVAAGNDGPMGRITSPANAYGAVCVAACNQDGMKADFSSIGPATGKNEEDLAKPDIMAWGENVVVARSYEGRDEGIQVHDEYQAMDGTSFASPFMAGCAALYKQAVGSLAGFKADIAETAYDSPSFTPDEEGPGRIDIYDAIAKGLGVDDVPPCEDGGPVDPIDPDPDPDPGNGGSESLPGCGTGIIGVGLIALAIFIVEIVRSCSV